MRITHLLALSWEGLDVGPGNNRRLLRSPVLLAHFDDTAADIVLGRGHLLVLATPSATAAAAALLLLARHRCAVLLVLLLLLLLLSPLPYLPFTYINTHTQYGFFSLPILSLYLLLLLLLLLQVCRTTPARASVDYYLLAAAVRAGSIAARSRLAHTPYNTLLRPFSSPTPRATRRQHTRSGAL